MKQFPLLALLLAPLALLLAGCESRSAREPLAISLVGDSPQTLQRALVQGLVALDSGGSVVPALAERWIVTDNGKSYIFRLKDINWSNGKPVTAKEVASLLRKAAAAPSHPLPALTRNMASIVPMTGRIIEIRLQRPDPTLLHLLTMPEFGIGTGGRGAGPFFVHSRRNEVTRLRLIPLPHAKALAVDAGDANDIRVRTEDASRAVARFKRGAIDLVMGGTIADIPVAFAARLPGDALRIEPARGLFGLIVTSTQGPLADARLRKALSLALDRTQIVGRFGVPDWPISTSVLPQALGGEITPSALEGMNEPYEDRLERARRLAGREARTVRVALPSGPGMRVIAAQLAAMWKPLGVTVVPVGFGKAADLRLINEIAPISIPMWYLDRLGCRRTRPCDPGSDALLDRAVTADDPAQRAVLLAQSDAALTEYHNYIPIARPLRWSLVRPELKGWRESPIALHPLNRLRPIVR